MRSRQFRMAYRAIAMWVASMEPICAMYSAVNSSRTMYALSANRAAASDRVLRRRGKAGALSYQIGAARRGGGEAANSLARDESGPRGELRRPPGNLLCYSEPKEGFGVHFWSQGRRMGRVQRLWRVAAESEKPSGIGQVAGVSG